MEKALIERRALDAESAHRIARIANGNWNHALEELDAGNENRQHLDMFIMLMRLVLHAQHPRPEEVERGGCHLRKREAEANARLLHAHAARKFHVQFPPAGTQLYDTGGGEFRQELRPIHQRGEYHRHLQPLRGKQSDSSPRMPIRKSCSSTWRSRIIVLLIRK